MNKRIKRKVNKTNIIINTMAILIGGYILISLIDVNIHNVSAEAAQHIWKYNLFKVITYLK